MHYKDSAVVIGNGESRSSLDLPSLKKLVTLIGCNAIHRDLRVDHLVCCDHRMVQEVVSRKKSSKIANVYTRGRNQRDYGKLHRNERIKLLPELPYQGILKPDQPEHWGSGPYAALLAAHLDFKNIFLIGFDLYGKSNLVNNIYKNTNNYLKEDKPAVDPAYWIYQMRKIFLAYPNCNFKIFNLHEWVLPEEWSLPNVKFFEINKFYLELDSTINSCYNKT
jgi:hypothetical protein